MAPRTPGAFVVPSDSAGIVAKTTLENALPNRSLSTPPLNSDHILACNEMKNNPTCRLRVQVICAMEHTNLGVGDENADSTSHW
jgi:hypothetical protein